MYSGIILEINKNRVIVKSKAKGYIELVKKPGMQVGENIYFFDEDIYTRTNSYRKYTLVAASLLIISMILGYGILNKGIKDYLAQKELPHSDYPYAVLLSIDINPSLELELDESLHVTDVRYINAEAEELIDRQLLLNKYYTVAVKDVLTVAREKGYIDTSGAVMISAIDTKHNKNELQIEGQITEVFKNEDQVKLVLIQSDEKLLKESREKEISLGKFAVYNTLNTEKTVEVSDIKVMKVADMVDDGIVDNDNSKIVVQEKKSSEEAIEDAKNEEKFIIKHGNEYINPLILEKMGFSIEYIDNNKGAKISRDDKTFVLDMNEAVLNYQGFNYIMLKDTFDFFSVKYDYKGYNITVMDDNNIIQLYYGNPAGKDNVGVDETTDNDRGKENNTKEEKPVKDKLPEKVKDTEDKERKSQDNTLSVTVPSIKTSDEDKMLVYQGVEFITESFLTSKKFTIEDTVEGKILIKYDTKEKIVDNKYRQVIDGAKYYPLKEVMDIFELEYGYNDEYFYIIIEGQEVKLKYRIVD